MTEIHAAYKNVQRAAREVFEGEDAGKVIKLGDTRIILSKVRKFESGGDFPEPYPEVDLPEANDYSSWLK